MAAVRSLQEVNEIMMTPGSLWETTDIDVHGRKLKAFKNLPDSLRDMWNNTKAFAHREYIVYEDERITYREAHARVDALAGLLYARGVRKGDRVGIAMRNLPEWLIAFWACHKLGAISAAVNAWLPAPASVHCIAKAECKVLFVDDERMHVLKGHIDDLRTAGCQHIFVAKPRGALVSPFEDMANAANGEPSFPDVDIQPEDLGVIFFTSGTTSLPKAVISTQRMYLSNRANTAVAAARSILRRGLSLPIPDPNEQKVMLLSVPLFHVTGNQSFAQLATATGSKLILMRKWDSEEAARLIIDEGVTLAGGVPHMALEAVERIAGKKHKLEGFSFGGGPASVKLPETVEKFAPGCSSAQGWGLTETNAVAAAFAGPDYVARPTSCGLPTMVTELKIIDPDTGAKLRPRETGEICVRGPQVALGYWRDEKATKEAFSEDGWFRTGDIGYIDDEGFLYIADRAKDIIIRGGENIATTQVENALYTHEAVKDAAVVPVPDPKLSELVAAVIVLRSSHRHVSEKDLQDHVASQLPKHCVPVMIEFRDEMARNANGKTMKKELKAELSKIWLDRQEKTFKAKL